MNYKEFIDEWNSDAVAIRAFTSGSTGNPKEILLPRDVIEQSAMRTINFFGIDANWRLHSCISPDFIGGKMVAVRAVMAGCELSFEIPSNKPVIYGKSGQVDMVSVVPSQMRYIIDHKEEFAQRARIYLIGGSSLPPGMAEDIAETGIECYESYGMTETASHIAIRRIGRDSASFRPLPGIIIGKDCRGCLTISGATHDVICTNDIVEINSDGDFEIIGRYDNMIISGGKKIHPELLENEIKLILSQMGFSGQYNDLIVTGEPDSKWGRRVILNIEISDSENIDVMNVRDVIAERLPSWTMPKEIRFVKKLQRTCNGKLRR